MGFESDFDVEAWEVRVRIVAPGGEKPPALDEEGGEGEGEEGEEDEGVLVEVGQGECVFAVGS